MQIVRVFCAIALLASATAAWPQKSYCDKAFCKSWTGPGWYVVYGGYIGNQMLTAGPLPDQAGCKVEAARLAKKNPEMVRSPIAGSNVEEVVGEFFCLLLESGEKAAKDYMTPA